jgi:hypothetical protein
MVLCALAAALSALAASTASAASEKSEVTKFARKKAVKEFNKTGFGVSLSGTTAKCKKTAGGYWSCKAESNGGQCTAKMRVYSSGPTTWVAPKKYFKGGCIADKLYAAGGPNGTEEKKAVKAYATRVFIRHVRKNTQIKLAKSDVNSYCTRKSGKFYWTCKLAAGHENGICRSKMHVYTASGKLTARAVRSSCTA